MVTKISVAGRGAAVDGMVTIRVRIAADGVLEGAAVEESSGSPVLDERALQAVRDAAPFAPPPEALLTLEGYTELTFPVAFTPSIRR